MLARPLELFRTLGSRGGLGRRSGFGRRASFGRSRADQQLPYQRLNVRARGQLGNQLFDLPFREVTCPRQDRPAVSLVEARGEQRDSRKVQPAVTQELEPGRVPAQGARHHDPQRRLRLGQVEALDAVVEHRRAGLPLVEAALVDLGDVGDEVGLDAARVAEDLRQAQEECRVRE